MAVPAAIAMVVLLRKSSLRWRCAALAGIAALWLWGTSFTLWSFLNYCLAVRMKGMSDPVAVGHHVGEALINAAATQASTAPLLIAITVTFFIHKPQVAGRDA